MFLGPQRQSHHPAGLAFPKVLERLVLQREPTVLTLKDLCSMVELAWADQPGRVFDQVADTRTRSFAFSGNADPEHMSDMEITPDLVKNGRSFLA